VIVINHLSLDGVMQSPGGEDPTGGFEAGAWAHANGDEVMDRVLGEHMAASRGVGGGLLFGRRTYELLLGYWNTQPDSPFTPVLNDTEKFVASKTLRAPLPYPNTTVLEGDVPSAVAALKRSGDGDLTVLGSGELLQSLMPHGLVDEYLLLIHPLVLGSGRKLFAEGATRARLELLDSVTTTTGVIIATYRTRSERSAG
jgi:dihydrofolate reductase